MFQFPAFATLSLCIQDKLPIIDTWKPQQQKQRDPKEIVAPRSILLGLPRQLPCCSDFPSTLGGFPHSEIYGSKGIRTSP